MTGPAICTPKSLPRDRTLAAAATAQAINPVNAPSPTVVAAIGVATPLRLSLLTSKYWGATQRTLTVSFMDSPPKAVRDRVIAEANAWSTACSFRFVYTRGTGMVRVARVEDGYWSYLGTDVLHIPRSEQTLNLEGFTAGTPDSEWHRVVRHEFGHTMGFPHEHMRRALVDRIDPQRAYRWFGATQNWGKQVVDEQVLTALEERELIATPADQTSIMCYQLPGSITKDGRPILGGTDINSTDYSLAARVYPKGSSKAFANVARERALAI